MRRDPENAPLETYGFKVFYVPDFIPPDSVAGIDSLYPGTGFDHQWDDYDNDGDPDLYLVPPSSSESNRLYRNDGGRLFTDVTETSGASLAGWMCEGTSSGDIDNDGDIDLAVIADLTHPFLLKNRGDGSFDDVSESVGLTGGLLTPRSIGMTDVDTDGFLDLLVVAEDGIFLYRSRDGIFFENEAGVRGLPSWRSDFTDALLFDADRDGDTDVLFIGNSGGFYSNESGYFVDRTSDSGLGMSTSSGTILDLGSDGDPDLLLNGAGDTLLLLENDGSGRFSDRSDDFGMSSITGTNPVAADFNNDGLTDIGFMDGDLFLLEEGERFLDVSVFSGISRIFSFVDADENGLVDVFMGMNRLSLNVGFPGGVENNWLEADLVGRVNNRSGVGAVVILYAGDTMCMRIVSGSSPVPKRLSFGFEEEMPDSLVIRWPAGTVQVETDLMVNAITEIEEDSTLTSVEDLSDPSRLPSTIVMYQNYPNPFNPQTTISFEVGGEPGSVHEVNVTIYDVRGRHVKTLLDGKLEAGRHSVVWDGRSEAGGRVVSGVYFSTLQTDAGRFTRKMTAIR